MTNLLFGLRYEIIKVSCSTILIGAVRGDIVDPPKNVRVYIGQFTLFTEPWR